MTINENHIRELLEQATPGPWTALATYGDGARRPDTTREMRAAGEYLGIMHTPNAELAARAPELAADWLRMRDELTDFRNLQSEVSINSAFFSRAWREAAELTRDRIDRILNGETND